MRALYVCTQHASPILGWRGDSRVHALHLSTLFEARGGEGASATSCRAPHGHDQNMEKCIFPIFSTCGSASRHKTPTCDSSSVAGRLIVDLWLPPVEQNGGKKKNLKLGAKIMKNIGSFRSAAAEGRDKMGKKRN